MGVKQIGVGITARAVSDLDFLGDESLEPAAKLERFVHYINCVAQSSIPGGWWAVVERLSRRCLKQAGYPTRAGFYRRRDDKWERWPRSNAGTLVSMRLSENPELHLVKYIAFFQSPELASYEQLAVIVEAETGTDSDQHFAAQIITQCHKVRLARRAGLQNMQEIAAHEIGHLTALWEIKIQAGPVWELGNKVRTGGEKGAVAAHGTIEERERKMNEINGLVELEMAKGLTLTEARNRVARKLRVSVSTVRRAQSSH